MGKRGRARLALVALAAAGALLLGGCVPGSPTPLPTYTPTSTGSSSPVPEPTPTFVPNGTAAENLDYFDYVVGSFFAANGMADGRRNIDNLVAAGFEKSDMEVTPDNTAVGFNVDSILYSVKVDELCLIAQVFATEYTTDLAPVLGSGRCLIGATRPIDW